MKTMMTATVLFLTLNAAAVYAAEQNTTTADANKKEQKEHMHQWIQKATKACEGKSVGDTVTLEGKEGKQIEAVCRLVAVRDHTDKESKDNTQSSKQ